MFEAAPSARETLVDYKKLREARQRYLRVVIKTINNPKSYRKAKRAGTLTAEDLMFPTSTWLCTSLLKHMTHAKLLFVQLEKEIVHYKGTYVRGFV